MEPAAHLLHLVSANTWGGVERYALDICRHFHREGWHVTVATRDAKAVDKAFEKEGIPLLHAPFGGMNDPASVFTLVNFMKKQPTDCPVIVHAHSFSNAFTALLARKIAHRKDIKVVMTRHKVKRALDTWILRRIYRNLDSIIFVSSLAMNRFLSTWRSQEYPFPPQRLRVIHNSLNIPAPKILTRSEKGPTTAMFHGPLLPGKGLETLIDAMAILKGTRLRLKIVGNGSPDYVDRLRQRAITRDVMSSIDWHRHSDNPMELIQDCDFGVLPSQREEAFGLANIEYMACGRPIVCTSNGAQPEYITDGKEAFLIPPGNPVALAEAMRNLASNTNLRQRMGQRAFETFVEKLSWQNFISHLSSVYLS